MSSASTLPLQGKVAIVTGGSKGIGAAITLHLLSLGANVVFSYSSDESSASALEAKINSEFPAPHGAPPRAVSFKGDSSSIPDIDALVDYTLKTYHHLNIVVANAAIMSLQDLAHTTEEIFDRHMSVNVKGPFFLAQRTAQHLGEGGRIIFLSSSLIANSSVAPPYLVYLATKGAIEQMVRVLARDLAKGKITVNAVAPGPTATDMFLNGKSDALLQAIKSSIPMGRFGTPEEIADIVGFLSGEGSRWVSGQVIRANGAMA
ncbi:NADPH-dependent aldehyde reductase-like protein, chloroplastic [Psilocybe cubensis]|uniref:NADPH-dependent aldehyde reductase-like protein, chloroplastic n=2 Tax=Psilocybe cubensis TaxID=181762 RepID=A0ACB8GPV5_PSICU|nr:NADPH-dependent aldehyde reductase-like protein, chloroplastic [Psilocybe cubensis]KAH9477437.1 NADPH-dependent aldehyde reductase-like protein, chloroplastic [Psilocybe cubensis]